MHMRMMLHVIFLTKKAFGIPVVGQSLCSYLLPWEILDVLYYEYWVFSKEIKFEHEKKIHVVFSSKKQKKNTSIFAISIQSLFTIKEQYLCF